MCLILESCGHPPPTPSLSSIPNPLPSLLYSEVGYTCPLFVAHCREVGALLGHRCTFQFYRPCLTNMSEQLSRLEPNSNVFLLWLGCHQKRNEKIEDHITSIKSVKNIEIDLYISTFLLQAPPYCVKYNMVQETFFGIQFTIQNYFEELI